MLLKLFEIFAKLNDCSLHCQQTMLYTFNIFSVFACVCDDHNLLCNVWQVLATCPTPQFMSVEACCKCVHSIYSVFGMHLQGAGKNQVALELLENNRADDRGGIAAISYMYGFRTLWLQ